MPSINIADSLPVRLRKWADDLTLGSLRASDIRGAADEIERLSKVISDETLKRQAFALKFRDWIADQIEVMGEHAAADGEPEQAAALHRAVTFIRASEANP